MYNTVGYCFSPPVDLRIERCGLGGMDLRAAMVSWAVGGGGRGAGCLIPIRDTVVLLFADGWCEIIREATIGVSRVGTVPLTFLVGVTTVVTARGTPVVNLICWPCLNCCDVTAMPFCTDVITFDWAVNVRCIIELTLVSNFKESSKNLLSMLQYGVAVVIC